MSFVLSNFHMNNLLNDIVSTIKQLVDDALYLSLLLILKLELMRYPHKKVSEILLLHSGIIVVLSNK